MTPEAAAGFPKVSNSGKTYDFTVNAGFTKFSNGQAVTAANFKAAFDRDADPKMQSPALPFFIDVVGSDKSPVSGVVVKGNHLIFNLTKAAPDFLARTAMPFFCADPDEPARMTRTACSRLRRQARTTSPIVQPNKSITIKKNPNYKGKRPHNVDADQLHHRQLARRHVPAHAAGRDRLRRRRHPARVVCRGRSEVRRQQGPVLGQAAARRHLPGVQP